MNRWERKRYYREARLLTHRGRLHPVYIDTTYMLLVSRTRMNGYVDLGPEVLNDPEVAGAAKALAKAMGMGGA